MRPRSVPPSTVPGAEQPPAAGSEAAIEPVDLREVTEERYRTYALSVIGSRALPDVRDGLKPVQRRILFTMWRQRLVAGGRFRKCAKVVGDVMGAYHPHGDDAIYQALVRMAQPFASRLPLIEGSGNFGSLDGDPSGSDALYRMPPRGGGRRRPRRARVGHRPPPSHLRRVPYRTRRSPPPGCRLLLVNGSTGIAVAVRTNIPPHNLTEVLDALIALLDEPRAGDPRAAALRQGPPTFPPAARSSTRRARLRAVYRKGRGPIRVRGTLEEAGVRRQVRTLYITSLPWGVNKAQTGGAPSARSPPTAPCPSCWMSATSRPTMSGSRLDVRKEISRRPDDRVPLEAHPVPVVGVGGPDLPPVPSCTGEAPRSAWS